METIMQYLDSMFRGLPQTKEVLGIKNDLKNNMEEKYEELKKEGKSENEAIGIVISEFGNIDELLQEMDIEAEPEEQSDLPLLSLEEAKTFLSFSKKTARNIAIGVLLILIGISVLIFTGGILDGGKHEAITILPLFLALIPAVALFIYSGMKGEQYQFIEKGLFRLSASTREFLEQEHKQMKDAQMKALILSVCLFILSPLLIIFTADMREIVQVTSVSFMILVIGIGVYIIIRFCAPADAYKKLLRLDNYSKEHKKAEKIIGAVAGVVWPLATVAFLIMGFMYDLWHIAWVIYPIVGVLFGAFSALVHGLVDDKEGK